MENVAKTVSETLEVSPERVRVLLYELPLTHWAIGGETAAKRRKEKTIRE
ncbi:tautomerase family protein [Brevibacillus humidisoli]|nr:tautomerase family protein [Brevibacillus humidisoli]UFJ41093.1 tautomerase family protein [Brevibacillus humidisoli]